MKVFISSIIVFTLLTSFIIFNCVTVCRYTDNLITNAESLSASPNIDETNRLINDWFKYNEYINLTVDHKSTDQIELVLFQLQCAAEYNDPFSFKTSRSNLLVYLKDLRKTASFSIERIL